MARYGSAPVPSTKMPSGIPYILSNEVAERFSFSGMRGILVVFMTTYLTGILIYASAKKNEIRCERHVLSHGRGREHAYRCGQLLNSE